MVVKLKEDKPQLGISKLLSDLRDRKNCKILPEFSNSRGNGENSNHCKDKYSSTVFETHFVETIATGFNSKSAVFRLRSSHRTSGITSKKLALRFMDTKFVKMFIPEGKEPRQLFEASKLVKDPKSAQFEFN
jgi:hypothetical protein